MMSHRITRVQACHALREMFLSDPDLPPIDAARRLHASQKWNTRKQLASHVRAMLVAENQIPALPRLRSEQKE